MLAKTYYSFMGLIPDYRRTRRGDRPRGRPSPEGRRPLTPSSWPPLDQICNRSVGLVARAIEAEGIPNRHRDDVQASGGSPSGAKNRIRALPFGQPLGEAGNVDQQRVIIEDALKLLVTASEPGIVQPLPYRWRREDYAGIRAGRGNVLKSVSRFLSE